MFKRLGIVVLLTLSSCFLLTGCVPKMLSKQLKKNVNEQLYVDARLDFAVKHPLDWQRIKVPVSSPEYRDDTVRWDVPDPQGRGPGKMLIRSRPTDPNLPVAELLSEFLAGEADLEQGEIEEQTLPAGTALMLTGHDETQGRLTIALKGQARDFIISLDCPSSRFDELLPIFQEITDSFVEVVQPTTQETEKQQ